MKSHTKVERLERSGAGQGNTDLPPLTRAKQAIYWCFTYNNPPLERLERLERVFQVECDWYVFQEEIGAEGTPHLQGTIKLKQRKRLSQLKPMIDPKVHWEPTKSVNASIEYCSKEASRTGKIYAYNIPIPEPLDIDPPKGWQLEVMNIITEKPDKRSIHWFWEPNGNVGKSTLCKYLVVKHEALFISGNGNDIAYSLSKATQKRIVLIDCPRTMMNYIPYGTIENIKNGLVFCGKYESQQLVFNCPHVIIFANCLPDRSKMSNDRWHVHDIRELLASKEETKAITDSK